jgi:hypothetical protein
VRRRLGLIYVAHEELADVAEDQTRCSRRTWIWNTPAKFPTTGLTALQGIDDALALPAGIREESRNFRSCSAPMAPE